MWLKVQVGDLIRRHIVDWSKLATNLLLAKPCPYRTLKSKDLCTLLPHLTFQLPIPFLLSSSSLLVTLLFFFITKHYFSSTTHLIHSSSFFIPRTLATLFIRLLFLFRGHWPPYSFVFFFYSEDIGHLIHSSSFFIPRTLATLFILLSSYSPTNHII